MIYFILILTQVEAFLLLYHIVSVHRKMNVNDERMVYLNSLLRNVRCMDRDDASPYLLDHLEKVLLTLQAYIDKVNTKIDYVLANLNDESKGK